MASLRAAWRIAAKDLRLRIRDRSAVIVGVIVPLGLATIFSLILGGVEEGVAFDYVVADEDGGPLGEVFTADVLAGLVEDGPIEVEAVDDAAAAERAVADGDADAGFVVPGGFSAAVTGGRSAAVRVIGSRAAPIGTEVARAVAEAFAHRLSTAQLAVAAVATGGGEVDQAVVARAGRLQPAIRLEQLAAADKQLSNTTFYAAGMAVFFLFFTVQIGVTGLLEERRDGTLDRLLAAPVGRGSVVAAKALTSLILGVASMTVLVVATDLLLGAQWGDPVAMAGLVVAGVVAAVGVMGVVGVAARTAEQANSFQSIVAVVLGLFGGVFFPVAQGPGLLADLALLTPHRWFMRGLEELAAGGGPAAAGPAIAVLLGFGLVGGGIAAGVARRVVRL